MLCCACSVYYYCIALYCACCVLLWQGRMDVADCQSLNNKSNQIKSNLATFSLAHVEIPRSDTKVVLSFI